MPGVDVSCIFSESGAFNQARFEVIYEVHGDRVIIKGADLDKSNELR